ncbi:MAG: nucleotidyltransferase family protein [Acidimicrobiales bacterium]
MKPGHPAELVLDLARLVGGGLDLLRCCTAADADGVREAWQRWSGTTGPPHASSFGGRRRRERGMLAMLSSRLREAQVETDAELATLLRMALVRERRRAEAHRAVLIEVLDAVDSDALVLRGPPLAEWAYHDPDLRHSGPLQILVEPGAFDSAAASVAAVTRHLGRAPGRAVSEHASGLEVVIATSLFPGRLHAVDASSVTAQRKVVTVAGRPVATLDPTLTLLELCVLCSSHPGVRHLRWPADAVLVAKTGEVDWDHFVETGVSWRLGPVIASTSQLLRDELGADIPADVPGRLVSAGRSDALTAELAVAAYREAVGGDLRSLLTHLPDPRSRWRAVRMTGRPSPAMQRLTGRPFRWRDQPGRATRTARAWVHR